MQVRIFAFRRGEWEAQRNGETQRRVETETTPITEGEFLDKRRGKHGEKTNNEQSH